MVYMYSGAAYMVEDILESIVSDGGQGGWVVAITKTDGMMNTLQHTTETTKVNLRGLRLTHMEGDMVSTSTQLSIP
jgi:hypothetical protein